MQLSVPQSRIGKTIEALSEATPAMLGFLAGPGAPPAKSLKKAFKSNFIIPLGAGIPEAPVTFLNQMRDRDSVKCPCGKVVLYDVTRKPKRAEFSQTTMAQLLNGARIRQQDRKSVAKLMGTAHRSMQISNALHQTLSVPASSRTKQITRFALF
jgi:hypothetical protein